MPRRERVLLTCEHGGNRVPRRHAALFRGHRALLRSHRGWDPGTLDLGRFLARRLGWPLVAATTTRLLVDLNRSPGHPALFSRITCALPDAEKARILAEHHRPHRAAVEAAARRGAGPVVHLALHSFTPVLEGKVRDVDVGILHDPGRPRERAFSLRLRTALRSLRPDLRVRLNRPYRGWTDGLTTWLRTRLPDARYAGIELEVNQRFPLGPGPSWRALRESIAASLEQAIAAAPRR